MSTLSRRVYVRRSDEIQKFLRKMMSRLRLRLFCYEFLLYKYIRQERIARTRLTYLTHSNNFLHNNFESRFKILPNNNIPFIHFWFIWTFNDCFALFLKLQVGSRSTWTMNFTYNSQTSVTLTMTIDFITSHTSNTHSIWMNDTKLILIRY